MGSHHWHKQNYRYQFRYCGSMCVAERVFSFFLLHFCLFCSIITWNFFCFMHYRETVFFLFYTYFRRSKYKYIRKFITVDWLDTKITFSNKSLYEKKKKSEAFNIYHCEGLAGVGEIFCQQFLPKQENSSRYLMLCFLSCGIYPFTDISLYCLS